jgi:alpha-L-fucosidase 2
LRGKGGYSIDVNWEKRQLSSAMIISKLNQTCHLRTKTPVRILLDDKKILFQQVEKNLYVFNIIAGKKYQIVAQ